MLCFFKNLSRSKPAAGGGGGTNSSGTSSPLKEKKKKKLPKLDEFLHTRDYVGAITFLEVSEGFFWCSYAIEHHLGPLLYFHDEGLG